MSLEIGNGYGWRTVDVQATGVPTYITENGLAYVNVGNAGSVRGILGDLYILNSQENDNTISLDDSADAVPRIATLSTLDSGFGEVTGLAPRGSAMAISAPAP